MNYCGLAIIGTGSGHSVIGHEMAGWDIAVIEDRRAGNTCLNYGCIPSKVLTYNAEVVHTVASAEKFDVDARLDGMRWGDVRDRVIGLTDQHSDEGKKRRQDADDITYYDGYAQFTGPREVIVTDHDGNRRELTADRVVVATVGRPVIPSIVADCRLPLEASNTIMRIDAPPRRLAVLSGANTDLILGAHLIGPQAATLVQIFVMAIEFGIPATDLARRSYWIHPALTEVVQNALLDVKEAA